MSEKNRIREIIETVTEPHAPPLVPEITLRLVTVKSPWWTLAPDDLLKQGIPEPFWAFAWGGGQSLARFILDHPHLVAGKHVIDFGTGGGIIALAALQCGADHVTATEIDPWAIVACEINLAQYEARVTLSCEDWIGRKLPRGSLLLCGDMSYEKALTARLMDWFESLEDCMILIGDPGRGFVDLSHFEELAQYQAPTDSDSDGSYTVRSSVLQFSPRIKTVMLDSDFSSL